MGLKNSGKDENIFKFAQNHNTNIVRAHCKMDKECFKTTGKTEQRDLKTVTISHTK